MSNLQITQAPVLCDYNIQKNTRPLPDCVYLKCERITCQIIYKRVRPNIALEIHKLFMQRKYKI